MPYVHPVSFVSLLLGLLPPALLHLLSIGIEQSLHAVVDEGRGYVVLVRLRDEVRGAVRLLTRDFRCHPHGAADGVAHSPWELGYRDRPSFAPLPLPAWPAPPPS